jgi:hypothetical protein
MTCSSCEAGTPSPEHREALVSIGESLTSEIKLNRGHDRTDYYFLQCPTCGSVWMNYRDGGVGGTRRFLGTADEEFFLVIMDLPRGSDHE